MHKVLQKQLKKLGFKDGEFPDGNLEKFIELVDTAYKEADDERFFLECTLETSSQEMEELYEELKQKSKTALAKSEQRYKELATKDMLTGILNRFAFENELNKLISNSLIEVAKRVVPNIRAEDIFARVGGDEFVLLFTNTKPETLPDLVNKAISLFRKPWVIDKTQLNVTTSMGVTVFPDDADNKNELMKKADITMYKSKELGRNQVIYFEKLIGEDKL